ncbi:hypothetical protein CR513_20447, partial [Mucuna pruriens]
MKPSRGDWKCIIELLKPGHYGKRVEMRVRSGRIAQGATTTTNANNRRPLPPTSQSHKQKKGRRNKHDHLNIESP